MQAVAGARRDVPLFLILLTDGKSQDDAVAAADRLKGIGVEIIAVGEREIALWYFTHPFRVICSLRFQNLLSPSCEYFTIKVL